MSDDLIDRRLGQYLITEVIAYGGMATVYKATQPSLDRVVAIKVLRHDADPQFAARFRREARATAALQHHNILPIYDNNEQDGLLYLVLQYIEDGRTLGGMLGRPMPLVPALRLMSHVFDALDYAHKRGIVHRDIKPSNILMPSPTWPMLADFGIAKLLNDSQMQLTMSNQIVGTATYMAPEQITGRPVDARTDLYSTGVVLYELLTGRVPFDADTTVAMMNKHVNEAPPPPRHLNPEIPVVLDTVLLRALAKDPDQRYQTIAEMAAELERVILQLDLHRTRSQITSLYEGGVQAFEQGHWDEAVERFDKLNALAPNYEDTAELLEAARAAQERAKAEARQRIELLRLRHQSTSQQLRSSPPPISAVAATNETRQLAPVIESSSANMPHPGITEPALETRAQPTIATSAQPPSRNWRGILLWILGAAAVMALAFLFVRSIPGQSPSQTPTVTPLPRGTALAANVPTMVTAPTSPIPTVEAPAAILTPTMAMATLPTDELMPTAGGMDTMPAHGSPEPTVPPLNGKLPAPPGKLVYEDDFEADALTETGKSGLVDDTEDPDFAHGFHPGVFRMGLVKPNTIGRVLLPRIAAGNFSMQIYLSDDTDNFNGDVAQGVIFRAQDESHLYTLLIDPRKGQYAVRKLNGQNTWNNLIEWKPSPLIKRKGNINQLRVDADRDMFRFYLNGELLDKISDQTYTFGMLGMIIANVDADEPQMHYDELKIWNNDPAPHKQAAVRKDSLGDLVQISGGQFVMGSYELENELPHIVTLPDFYIDRTEVTNAAYKQCVAAGKCAAQSPESKQHPQYATDPQYANFPVINVSWQQSRDFCTWANKRLPTEAEWEKAASWDATTRMKFVWPWGNVFAADRMNSVESGLDDTSKVSSFPQELNGTFDIAGNVSEWTSSLYDKPYPYNATDGREDPQAQGNRVYRGGSYLQTQGKARGFWRRGAAPTQINREFGFRCAASQ